MDRYFIASWATALPSFSASMVSYFSDECLVVLLRFLAKAKTILLKFISIVKIYKTWVIKTQASILKKALLSNKQLLLLKSITVRLVSIKHIIKVWDSMDSEDRTEYLSKIEEIRQRITSKHSANRENKYKLTESNEGQNEASGGKVDPLSIAKDLEKRRPLESVENKNNQFNERVKELDSVSERIKVMLAHKRSPTTFQNTNNFVSNTQKPQKTDKLTSLFQKNIQFSQSKVAELTFGDFRSRDFSSTYREKYTQPQQSQQFQSQISQKGSDSSSSKTVTNKAQSNSNAQSSVFDIESFKKRFTKDSVKDNLKNKYAECPPSTYVPSYTERPQPKRQAISLKTTPQLADYPQTKKLLEALSRQIQLQAKLKVSKEKFDAFRAQNKLTLLKDQLAKRRMSISERQLDEWIKIQEQQFDPFVSIIFTKDFNFHELITNLTEARNNWQQRVKKCVQLEQLTKEQFKIKQIEAFKRGTIYLQDFVCFINLKNDSCLKNRDLFSLFKHFMCLESPKLGAEHKIRYETFINYVGK